MTEKRAVVVRLDEQGRDQVRRFLEQHGFQVQCSGNGAEALDLMREGVPDLVVADAVLPKLSGFDLCRETRRLAEPERVPFVLVLEESDSYGRGRARAEGVDLVLSEPLVDDDLRDLLNVRAGDGETVDSVLSGGAGSRDRFLKELFRAAPGRNEPLMAKVSDPLTGLHQKGFITLKLEEEFKKAQRYGNPFALLLVEVDNYQDVLKRQGKQVAHEMLLELAGIFLCESRDVDAAGRVEEARFMLLLPNTDLSGARIMADRVFQQVCARSIRAGDTEIPLRVSVGIAALPSEDVAAVDELADRAIRAMRTAQNLGGNRICAWGDSSAVKT